MKLFHLSIQTLIILSFSTVISAYFVTANAESYPAKEKGSTSKAVTAPAPKTIQSRTSKKRAKTAANEKPTESKSAIKQSATQTKLPPILAEIENKYVRGSTLSARFSQVNELASTGQKKKSSGVILLKHPNKLRWETLSPDKNLLVSDGKTFWFYTPPFEEGERGQVIIRKTSEIQSRLANLLLSGSFSSMQGMKLEQKSPTEFQLIPKSGTAGTVKTAQVQIDADKKVIQKVTLEHEGGNRSEITLNEIEIGKELDPRYFSFVIPPGTDQMKQ